MSNKKKPLTPEKQQDLLRAFEEGEFQHQLAQDKFAFALKDWQTAIADGDKKRIAKCEAKVEAARTNMNELRYAPAKPKQ